MFGVAAAAVYEQFGGSEDEPEATHQGRENRRRLEYLGFTSQEILRLAYFHSEARMQAAPCQKVHAIRRFALNRTALQYTWSRETPGRTTMKLLPGAPAQLGTARA